MSLLEVLPWIVIAGGIIWLTCYRYLLWLGIRLLCPAVTSEEGEKSLTTGHSAATTHDNWMRIVVSLLVLLAALYVILANATYGEASQKWAFGSVGLILGHWLKK